VRFDGEYSTVRSNEYGVPQGFVLGPLLFISFIDDVSGVIHFCCFRIYADDLQIYHSSSVADLHRYYDEVNADSKRIYDWAGSNGLKQNPKKSQVILTQSDGDVPQHELFVGPESIKMVPKVRNLRFILNNNLTPVVCQRIH
jgi:hypothetical protein